MLISRPAVLRDYLALHDRCRYLEVGVSMGETFFELEPAHAVAVDPFFQFDLDAARRNHPSAEFHQVTSDTYFSEVVKRGDLFQVIYLDGLHTVQQTLRDMNNALHHLTQDGVIIVDDVVPNSYKAALPSQGDAVAVQQHLSDPDHSWMGDTYKLVFVVRCFFPTLALRTISDNHGQAVIWRRSLAQDPLHILDTSDPFNLTFLDVVRRPEVFAFGTHAEILLEYQQGRA